MIIRIKDGKTVLTENSVSYENPVDVHSFVNSILENVVSCNLDSNRDILTIEVSLKDEFAFPEIPKFLENKDVDVDKAGFTYSQRIVEGKVERNV